MAEPTSAAEAARRVRAFLDARTAYRQSLGAPRVAYLTDEIARQVTDATPSTAYTWFGDVRTLSESDLIALLDEREQLRARLADIGETETEWSVLHVSGRDGPLGEADARRFAAHAACAGARLENCIAGEWRPVDDSAGEEGGGGA